MPVSGGGWTWTELRKINYFLENYDNIMPAEAGKKYAAIARFFRAYFYFDKVSRFGDVPWYSKTIAFEDEETLKKQEHQELRLWIRYLPIWILLLPMPMKAKMLKG
ncbi:hypothetical protein [Pedobacter steynii]